MTSTAVHRGNLVVRRGKRIPRNQLCRHCRLRRIVPPLLTCKACSLPPKSRRPPPPPLFPKPEPFRPSLEALQAQAEADALARWPRKDMRPKAKKPPSIRYRSRLCWNCSREKINLVTGEPLDVRVWHCTECSTRHCLDLECMFPGNLARQYYHDGQYSDYCELHHNERAYCKTCGKSKPFDGRELCSHCNDKFQTIYKTRLYTLHRKYHYLPPHGSMTPVPRPPNLILP
jgi:hypothetical protein